MSGDAQNFANHKARVEKMWELKSGWQQIYDDAYRYVIPHRKPSERGNGVMNADEIFDMTAPMSAMNFAGQLQRDLFPPGEAPYKAALSGLAALSLTSQERDIADRAYEDDAKLVHTFFHTGEWDMAIHEACLELAIGTAAIMPVKGTIKNPVIFACIPCEQLAVENDAWGNHTMMSWRQKLPIQAIYDGFKDGNFSAQFKEKLKAAPYDELTLVQDFTKLADDRWRFDAYVYEVKDQGFIATSFTMTQPIAAPRYFKMPGDAYGRGPILQALPTIKTLNKAQELTLKAAAMQMLGLWAGRAGGTFNPDTVSLSPGEIIMMESTGGLLGPDLQRLDVASGRIDIGGLVTDGLQRQVRSALFDDRIHQENGTPRSASEIAGLLQQRAETNVGAFGRLAREIMPVVAPRVMEILSDFNILQSSLSTEKYVMSIEIESPMAQALKANKLSSLSSYIEFVTSLVGPDRLPQFLREGVAIDRFANALQIDRELVPDEQERNQASDALSEQIEQQEVAALTEKAAPQLVALAGGQQ